MSLVCEIKMEPNTNLPGTIIRVCHGRMCLAKFSNYTFDRAKQELKIESTEGGVTADGHIKLEKCACQGQCSKGPNIVLEKNNQKTVLNHMTSQEMGSFLKSKD